MSLHRYACLTATAAFFLLIAGGLVTSTGSALAVPDWPLAYGRFFPPMTGGVLFEHGHRMIAGAVAVLTFGLLAWVHMGEQRLWVRHLAKAAAGMIVLQALLGGITVLYRLPPAVSVAHACLGQGVFCALVALAQATSPGRGQGGSGPLWPLGAAAVLAVFAQLLLGAVYRHTGRGFPLHFLGALAASFAVGYAAYKFLSGSHEESLSRPTALLLGLLPLQWLLGVLSWLVRERPRLPSDFWHTVLPTAHVACGALILATAVVWTMRARGTP